MIEIKIKVLGRDESEIEVTSDDKMPPLVGIENALNMALRRVLEHQHQKAQEAAVKADKEAKREKHLSVEKA